MDRGELGQAGKTRREVKMTAQDKVGRRGPVALPYVSWSQVGLLMFKAEQNLGLVVIAYDLTTDR